MRSVLTVINDESLINRIKRVLNNDSIKYHYASSLEMASQTAADEEIAVAIIDFNNPIVSGQELCELLLSLNSRIQFIVFFDEKDCKEVLDLYNQYHINKLMCKEYLVLEDLPSHIESCMHMYYREEEIEQLDDEVKKLNDLYLMPMHEMSSVLNERLFGYSDIIKVFISSIDFVLDYSEETLKSVNTFVDRIINDYIQIFLVKEPDTSVYFERIHETFNKPDDRKYFKFICDDVNISDNNKHNLLFVLDVLTIYFDVFYQYYRGKLTIRNIDTDEGEDMETNEQSDINKPVQVNAIYEVRKHPACQEIYGYMFKALEQVLNRFSKDVQLGTKDSLIQFKAVIS